MYKGKEKKYPNWLNTAVINCEIQKQLEKKIQKYGKVLNNFVDSLFTGFFNQQREKNRKKNKLQNSFWESGTLPANVLLGIQKYLPLSSSQS